MEAVEHARRPGQRNLIQPTKRPFVTSVFGLGPVTRTIFSTGCSGWEFQSSPSIFPVTIHTAGYRWLPPSACIGSSYTYRASRRSKLTCSFPAARRFANTRGARQPFFRFLQLGKMVSGCDDSAQCGAVGNNLLTTQNVAAEASAPRNVPQTTSTAVNVNVQLRSVA